MESLSDTASEYAERKLTALLNATVDAIIMIDHRGYIEVFNHSAETIFGYCKEEVIGKKINMLMPEPFKSQHDHYLSQYHDTGQAKIIGIGREVVALRKDGSEFPIDLAVGEFHDGHHLRYVGIVRDISDRKAIEAQLKAKNIELLQQRERLAHVDRIGMMGEMATGIAHEINQPLSAISTYAQACRKMLQNEQTNHNILAETLDKISAQAERAGEVIRRLRSFLRKGDTRHAQHDIHAIINEVIKMAEPDLKLANIPVELQFNASDNKINVDSIQIQQVILNLIRNSLDAMQSDPESDHAICILTRTIKNGKAIQVTVNDNGPGINDSARDHIFHPFFTTKKSGMGMGLSICRSIINNHGGKMEFQNNPKRGVGFYFTLPTVPDEARDETVPDVGADTP